MRFALPMMLLLLAGRSLPAAADEKEWLIALAPSAAWLKVGDRDAWGGGGGLDLSYGVTDALAVRLTGALSLHALPDLLDAKGHVTNAGGRGVVWFGGAGVAYSIDVGRLVPSLELAIGAMGTQVPDKGVVKSSIDLGVEIGLGVDYQLTRHVALGVIVRYHATITSIAANTIGTTPSYIYAGLRIVFHFGG